MMLLGWYGGFCTPGPGGGNFKWQMTGVCHFDVWRHTRKLWIFQKPYPKFTYHTRFMHDVRLSFMLCTGWMKGILPWIVVFENNTQEFMVMLKMIPQNLWPCIISPKVIPQNLFLPEIRHPEKWHIPCQYMWNLPPRGGLLLSLGLVGQLNVFNSN